jgi:hypothetical protein
LLKRSHQRLLSAFRPASVIRTRATSMVRPPATTRSAVAVASPSPTSLTLCSTVKRATWGALGSLFHSQASDHIWFDQAFRLQLVGNVGPEMLYDSLRGEYFAFGSKEVADLAKGLSSWDVKVVGAHCPLPTR